MNKYGVLLIHGFGGNIDEIKYLNDYISNKNYNTLAVKLRGHTGSKHHLRNTNYKDWIDSVEEGFLKLKKENEKIIVIGFSMGGLLAIDLYSKNKECIDKIVTINTPIYIWNIKLIIKNILLDIKNKSKRHISKYLKGGNKYPLNALYNFNIFLLKTKEIIKHIDCEILITQATHDEVVNVKSAKYIFDRVKSENKQIKYYNDFEHVILNSISKEQISKDIFEFISEKRC
ncbi:MAG: alpha/beta fold hydrolase [Peptostreptococcaceae bacterium]|jgi:carboxylesterase|nr:alpha/beta fold hydrolase [Peptostreptococcaceae bacterium]